MYVVVATMQDSLDTQHCVRVMCNCYSYLHSGVCRISLCFTSNVLYIVPVSPSVGGLHEALCRLMYNIAVGGSLLVSAPKGASNCDT